MSTKCQYRPLISTGVYHSGENRPLWAIQAITLSRTEANHHVRRVETGHQEVQREEDLDVTGVRSLGRRNSAPGT